MREEKPLSGSHAFVLDFLSERGPSLLTDIMAAAKAGKVCESDATRKAAHDLARLNRIRRINADERGAPAIYELIEEEHE